MRVCPNCFETSGLRRRIVELRPSRSDGPCDFHPTKKGLSIEVVAKIVDPVFRENYYGSWPDGFDDGAGSSLEDALYDLTGADDQSVTSALIAELSELDDYWPPDGEEPFYSDDYEYFATTAYSPSEQGERWLGFRHAVMHGQRFFSAEAREALESIFAGVHQQRNAKLQGPVYLIRPGDPEATFFRARIVNDGAERQKIAKNMADGLGSPPERLRRAGRLNPAGIAVFYAAYELDTCVAELRPPVGSIVLSGRFQLTKPICVLDVTRFGGAPKEPDLFAKAALLRIGQWRFMRTFMGEIAKPVMPGDEHLDYVATQAVAEYLVRHHWFMFDGERRSIDAIIFHSSQRPEGRNIAILGDAAELHVAPPDALSKSRKPVLTNAPGLRTRRGSLVAVEGSVETHRVSGAQFKTQRLDEDDDL